MTLKADLEILRSLSTTLHGLADESSSLVVEGTPPTLLLPLGAGPIGSLESVVEATKIAVDTTSTMVPAMTDRLEEIGNLMMSVAIEFGNADQSLAERMAGAYTSRSGSWEAPQR